MKFVIFFIFEKKKKKKKKKKRNSNNLISSTFERKKKILERKIFYMFVLSCVTYLAIMPCDYIVIVFNHSAV